TLMGLRVRVILNGGLCPGGGDGRIGAEAELGNEAWEYAEKACVVEIVVLDEVVEAVGAERSPGAGYGDGEGAAGGVELDLIGVGSFGVESCRVEQGAVVGGGDHGLGGGGGGGFRFGGRGGSLRDRGDSERERG